ncbi:MAG: biotin--[acetyl-CoA-carboxylase] ligase [Firmicutes bacterium]|nr:biotin--[acetyl-CoA-carboxylase] ligase [Bacillota bacterium]
MQDHRFDTNLLKSLLTTKRFGSRIFYFDVLDSTSNKAKKLAKEGIDEGAVIIASTQVKARGRMEREWQSPEGGLWFSLVLRPPAMELHPLTIIFGAAISAVIEAISSVKCQYHWVNDLYVNDRKLGGILMEGRFRGMEPEYVIVGIGINLNFHAKDLSGEFNAPPTTLLDERGEFTASTALLAAILNRLEKEYDRFLEEGPTEIIHKYKNRCVTVGRKVRIINSGEIEEADAEALDLTEDGGLMVELGTGSRGILYSAERLILLDS